MSWQRVGIFLKNGVMFGSGTRTDGWLSTLLELVLWVTATVKKTTTHTHSVNFLHIDKTKLRVERCISADLHNYHFNTCYQSSPVHKLPLIRLALQCETATVHDIKRGGEQNCKLDEQKLFPDVQPANSFIQIMEIITPQGKYHAWTRGGKGDRMVSQLLNILELWTAFSVHQSPTVRLKMYFF